MFLDVIPCQCDVIFTILRDVFFSYILADKHVLKVINNYHNTINEIFSVLFFSWLWTNFMYHFADCILDLQHLFTWWNYDIFLLVNQLNLLILFLFIDVAIFSVLWWSINSSLLSLSISYLYWCVVIIELSQK